MGVAENVRELAASVPQRKRYVRTEEATKNAFVMPFISALGYDIHDPLEVIPEFTADAGVRQQEKVDYAIMKDGRPSILVECKSAGVSLGREHLSQLLRYYAVTDARFGILTNGVVYQFYTDLVKRNVMDEEPFLVVNMLELSDDMVVEVCRFAKSEFGAQAIWDLVNTREKEQKELQIFRDNIAREFANPSRDLVRILARGVLGRGHQRRAEWERVTRLTKRAIDEFNDSGRPAGKTVNESSSQRPVENNFDIYKGWSLLVSNESLHSLFQGLCAYVTSLNEEMWIKPITDGFSVKRQRGGHLNLLYIWPAPTKTCLTVQLQLDLTNVPLEEGFTQDISRIENHRPYTLHVFVRSQNDLERAKPLIKRSYDEAG